ncbi:hypothetical protein VNO77_03998 [Canavalia gladiata]|uniref:Uncharacterized protein n=1 Tax=Canavalia gladiata TaxID=3824 RepID=A0AAN9MWL8_CANGL
MCQFGLTSGSTYKGQANPSHVLCKGHAWFMQFLIHVNKIPGVQPPHRPPTCAYWTISSTSDDEVICCRGHPKYSVSSREQRSKQHHGSGDDLSPQAHYF